MATLLATAVFGAADRIEYAETAARPASANPKHDQVSLASYELIGTINFPTGYQVAGTNMGGLSSITYDSSRGVFYALSDDRS